MTADTYSVGYWSRFFKNKIQVNKLDLNDSFYTQISIPDVADIYQNSNQIKIGSNYSFLLGSTAHNEALAIEYQWTTENNSVIVSPGLYLGDRYELIIKIDSPEFPKNIQGFIYKDTICIAQTYKITKHVNWVNPRFSIIYTGTGKCYAVFNDTLFEFFYLNKVEEFSRNNFSKKDRAKVFFHINYINGINSFGSVDMSIFTEPGTYTNQAYYYQLPNKPVVVNDKHVFIYHELAALEASKSFIEQSLHRTAANPLDNTNTHFTIPVQPGRLLADNTVQLTAASSGLDPSVVNPTDPINLDKQIKYIDFEVIAGIPLVYPTETIETFKTTYSIYKPDTKELYCSLDIIRLNNNKINLKLTDTSVHDLGTIQQDKFNTKIRFNNINNKLEIINNNNILHSLDWPYWSLLYRLDMDSYPGIYIGKKGSYTGGITTDPIEGELIEFVSNIYPYQIKPDTLNPDVSFVSAHFSTDIYRMTELGVTSSASMLDIFKQVVIVYKNFNELIDTDGNTLGWVDTVPDPDVLHDEMEGTSWINKLESAASFIDISKQVVIAYKSFSTSTESTESSASFLDISKEVVIQYKTYDNYTPESTESSCAMLDIYKTKV